MGNCTKSSMAILGTILMIIFMGHVCRAKAIETPKYKVVESETGFEIRLYTKSTWMSASIPHLSFAKATRIGYHRLFQYIQGANLNASRIPMTIPVLTSIVPDTLADFVGFYLPPEFQADPPTPLPELNLTPRSFDARCIAARKFSGFARDWNIGKEAEKLVASLVKSEWANSTAASGSGGLVYSVAQYSSPFKFTKRLNEVWIDIDGSGLKDCRARGVASY